MASYPRRSSDISITTSCTSPVSIQSPSSNLSTPASVPASTADLSLTAPPGLSIRPSVIDRTSNREAAIPINKMAMAAVVSPMPDQSPPPNLPVSITSKEWVVPPRPKPGRKPATDTPPTKRKAQNRAAQRAFRERRAARIGELEEQLEEQKEDHESAENKLLEKIAALETEANTLRGRCQALEGLLESERREGERIRADLEGYRRRWDEARGGSSHPRSAAVETRKGSIPPPSRFSVYSSGTLSTSRQSTAARQSVASLPISHIISPPETGDLTCGSCGPDGACACAEAVMTATAIGCGRCTLDSRCECLEAGLAADSVAPSADLKRPLRSPTPTAKGPNQKRQRSDASETDAAAGFAGQEASLSTSSSAQHIPPAPHDTQQLAAEPDKDGCGFCKQGTYCVCADAALAIVSAASRPATAAVPGVSQHHQMTPPPSDSDVGVVPFEVMSNGAVKLPTTGQRQAASATSNGRAGPCSAPGGPGTCAQCLTDPKSGLFCRSLAANFARTHPSASDPQEGCCGNAGVGGCCKRGGAGPAKVDVTLSCADTYKTLSSHRHFDEAADDIGAWLPLLKAARPPPASRSNTGGAALRGSGAADRPPIEVEAASIMSVLKSFDVRFGR